MALARAAQPGAAGDGDVVAVLQRVGTQIRAAVEDLRLGDQAGGTFAQRVAELVQRHRAAAPECTFELVFDDVPDQLPAEMSADVLPLIGEALTNARRHAGARHVEVRVEATESALLASVTDDGVGIGDQADGGHGLPGMRERAELLGGELRVVARPQGGTVVELRALMFAPRPPGERARVLLVDDHAAIREAMALAFADDGGFVVAAQAGSLAEARTMLDDIDVAIVDLALPDGDGGDLIAELRAANTGCETIVLTAQVGRAATARAVEKGAAAVLSKATHLHDVVTAVRRLRAGETLIPLDEMVELLRFAGRERDRELHERELVASLTPREREVLQLLAEGLDGRRIAARLHISPRTQRNHVANILSKLGVHSQLQALVFALRHGVVVASERTLGG